MKNKRLIDLLMLFVMGALVSALAAGSRAASLPAPADTAAVATTMPRAASEAPPVWGSQ